MAEKVEKGLPTPSFQEQKKELEDGILEMKVDRELVEIALKKPWVKIERKSIASP